MISVAWDYFQAGKKCRLLFFHAFPISLYLNNDEEQKKKESETRVDLVWYRKWEFSMPAVWKNYFCFRLSSSLPRLLNPLAQNSSHFIVSFALLLLKITNVYLLYFLCWMKAFCGALFYSATRYFFCLNNLNDDENGVEGIKILSHVICQFVLAAVVLAIEINMNN